MEASVGEVVVAVVVVGTGRIVRLAVLLLPILTMRTILTKDRLSAPGPATSSASENASEIASASVTGSVSASRPHPLSSTILR